MKKVDQLTATRFISVMFILYAHGGANLYIPFNSNPYVAAVLASAPTVVGYLYVLSGFVMSLAYYKPGENVNIRKFWIARFVRIYPLYILSFLLTCYFYLDGLAKIKPQKILANLFILQGWIPAYSQSFNIASWSLTVEIFFYAIFPFLIYWAQKQSTRKLLWSAIALWAVSQLIYQVLWTGYFPAQRELLLYNPFFHLNSFVMGVVGGIWYLRHGRDEKVKPGRVLAVLSISLALTAGYAIVSLNYFPALPHGLQPMAGFFSPILLLTMSALAVDKTGLSTFLSNPIFVNLGEAAYGMYIFHIPFGWIYERALENLSLADPGRIFEITYVPLVFAIGLGARAYLDPPIRNWMKKIIENINVPLLLFDYVIISASIYICFRVRFGDGREYLSYRNLSLVMFWLAFLIQPFIIGWFGGLSRSISTVSYKEVFRSLLISISVGTILLFIVLFILYSLGWFDNFPRSIFLFNWALVLAATFLIRLLSKFIGSRTSKNMVVEAV